MTYRLKNTHRVITLLILVAILISCKTDKNKSQLYEGGMEFIRDSLITVDLHGELMELDTLKTPVRIFISPDGLHMYLINMSSTFLIDVFSLEENNKQISSFIGRGQGPNELINTANIQFLNDTTLVIPGSPSQKKILFFDRNSVLNQKYPKPLKTVNLSIESPPHSPRFLSSGNILDLTRVIGQERFVEFGAQGENLGGWAKYPEPKNQQVIPDKLKFDSFYGAFDINQKNDLLVLTHFRTDLIQIYDTKAREIKLNINGPDFFAPSMTTLQNGTSTAIVPTSKNKEAYRHPVFSPDNSFMVGYKGTLTTDRVSSLNECFLFDLNDNSITRFILDQPIIHFDVDWKDRVIYGLSSDTQFREFGVFKFKF